MNRVFHSYQIRSLSKDRQSIDKKEKSAIIFYADAKLCKKPESFWEKSLFALPISYKIVFESFMPIVVHSSDDLSVLASTLLQLIHTESVEQKGLHSPVIVIPNLTMETWLSLEFAKSAEVTASIRFLFFEKAISELFIRKFKSTEDSWKEFLQPREIQLFIYSFLIAHPDLVQKYESLNRYLLPEGREKADPVRIFDLAARISKYFKDYELHRQDWIRNWLGKDYEILKLSEEELRESEATKSETFFLEKEIYSQVTAFLGSKGRETLLQSAMKVFGSKDRTNLPDAKNPQENFYIFGLSQFAPAYIAMFRNRFPELNVHVFQFGFPGLDHAEDSGFKRTTCRSWSQPFLVVQKNWKLAGAHFIKYTPDRSPRSSNLRSFQRYLLGESEPLKNEIESKAIPITGKKQPADGSILVLETPGKFREVESIYHSILAKLDADDHLKLTEIGIFCTNLAEYRAAIEFSFEGGIMALVQEGEKQSIRKKTIPYTIRDLTVAETSSYMKGILSIFMLLLSGKNRSNLFALYRNPCFQNRWKINSSFVDHCIEYAKDLNLFLDTDDENIKEPFSFGSGFLRLALGEILPQWAEKEIGISPFEQNEPMIEKWIHIWISLNQKLAEFQQVLADPNVKTEIFLESFQGLLSSTLLPDQASEIEIESEVDSVLFRLRDIDWDPKTEEDRIHFLETYLLESVSGLPIRKGKYLTDGITISALQPMRPIPFKHIYILGMGEGLFPGSEDRSAFNLRYLSPRESDITAKQADESLLYETILSAKESLTFSFVNQDIGKDEELAPSSSLVQIEQALKEHILSDGEKIRVRIPLSKSSKSYFESSQGIQEIFKKTYDISASLVYGPLETRQKYCEQIINFGLSSSAPISRSASEVSIDLSDLVKFWNSPLSHRLQKKFGMYVEDAEETENISWEPFRLESRENYLFRQEFWSEALDRITREKSDSKLVGIFSDAFTNACSRFTREGRIPKGIFGEIEIEDLESQYKSLVESLDPLLSGCEYFDAIVFGEKERSGSILRINEPLIESDVLQKVVLTGEKKGIFYQPVERKFLLFYPFHSSKFRNYFEPFLVASLMFQFRQQLNREFDSIEVLFAYGDKLKQVRIGGEQEQRIAILEETIRFYFLQDPVLVSADLWEDFTKAKLAQKDPEIFMRWCRSAILESSSDYLNSSLRILPRPWEYLSETGYSIAQKIYSPLESLIS
ncbi:hypothetical protein CH373_06625 [Leptospira perolatii]|uniref:RecC C-terminal domain-containing protein n=1 Tax=Leptospira perolatii TaxID=2023191 RepID=A0A2M9ZP19_9LEPT|nr:exodeoxyribonuclease V subunit gamma [Leptospira perolatii]PJZ73828.1 hypothetical protein CH373_06625 [Leptospira perolatii]